MHKTTFLTEKQLWDKEKLEIFKNYGRRAALTDFSIILGAEVSKKHTFDGNYLENRTGSYWTKSKAECHDARTVDDNGCKDFGSCQVRVIANRPILISPSKHLISAKLDRDNFGLEEITYGEYPQTAASNNTSKVLEEAFNSGLLNETGKEYTVDSRNNTGFYDNFSPLKLKEYEYLGKKYVRAKVNIFYSQNVLLSNGETYKNKDYVWVEVEPIVWFKEPGKDLYVSKKCLYAGVRFDKANGKYYESKFDKTEANNFLQNYFSKEIIPSKIKKEKKTINEFIYIDDETRKKTHKRIIVKVKR